MFEFIEKNQTLVASFCGFLLAQILGYIQLKLQVKSMLNSINGVGRKVEGLKSEVHFNHKELTDKYSANTERVAHIEGMIKVYTQFGPNGNA